MGRGLKKEKKRNTARVREYEILNFIIMFLIKTIENGTCKKNL